MKQYGLIGYPLGHSYSARFFAEKFAREGIDATYSNFEMPTVDGLRAMVAQQPELCGLNVTIPHKQSIMALLDSLSPEAQAIGAVNVVRIERQAGTIRLEGHNTDAIGFDRSIAPLLRPIHEAALVLGTGGASRAVFYALRQLGIAPQLVSRKGTATHLAYEELTPAVMQRHKIIVNCSPVGMYPHVDEAPAIPYDQLTPDHLLYDLVYNPEQTAFMRRGAERGATVKNGLEMLRLQALAAWDIWNAAPSAAVGSLSI